MTQTAITANQANFIARPAPYFPTQTRQTFEDQLLHPNRIYAHNGFAPHGFQAPRGFGMDLNGDGVLDPGEDVNGNGILDSGEDTNGNGVLDDVLPP